MKIMCVTLHTYLVLVDIRHLVALHVSCGGLGWLWRGHLQPSLDCHLT